MKSLQDKSIIITGAAMGLGYATAEEFAEYGAKLALVDYNSVALAKATKTLSEKYPNTLFIEICIDVSKEEDVKKMVNKTIEDFGSIDGLYNNAGIEGKQAKVEEYDLEFFKKIIDINLMGVYYCMKHIIPVMKKQGYGRIVNASSVAGIRGIQNQVAYVASKHAVAGITKTAAMENAEYGITVNAIAPGAILTPMVEEAFKQMSPEDPQAAIDAFAARNPTRRIGKPEEVAKVVAFLLSPESSYLNGQIIAIDGGESSIYGNS